jgi:UDP-N-acetylglucosamine 2-epimerase
VLLIKNIYQALRELAVRYGKEVQIVYPVHLNPNVQDTTTPLLAGVLNIFLTGPIHYLQLAHLMHRSYLVLTDSREIQEESPPLGVPVVALRNKTKSPADIEAGTVKLVGTDKDKIISEAENLLNNQNAYDIMARTVNPYGDGHASERIVFALLGEPFRQWEPRIFSFHDCKF